MDDEYEAALIAFEEYLHSSSTGQLEKLRRAILNSESYAPDSPWLSRSSELFSEARFDETIREISSAMPGAFLSPIGHHLLSLSYESIGDKQNALAHKMFAQTALELITESGRGSAESPWVVLRVADEYALLRTRNLIPARQETHRSEGILDEIVCTDGSQHYFRVLEPRHD